MREQNKQISLNNASNQIPNRPKSLNNQEINVKGLLKPNPEDQSFNPQVKEIKTVLKNEDPKMKIKA